MAAVKQRFVLDTNQIVGAGSRWLDHGASVGPNPHRRLLVHVATEQVGLYCSEIIDEYLEKLIDRGSPENRARRLIAYVQGAFEAVDIVSTEAPVPPADPDDDVFILCSLDGNADFLVTEDSDLLAIRTSYVRPVIAPCAEVLTAVGQ